MLELHLATLSEILNKAKTDHNETNPSPSTVHNGRKFNTYPG
jgi:hypothetical protein